MKRTVIIIILLSMIFISACNLSKPTCNEPYILVGNDCCLDQNNNKICDKDETQEIKEKLEQQKTVEKLKEAIENTTEEGVYNIISKAFDKYCWIHDEGVCMEYNPNNLSQCLVREPPFWEKRPPAQSPNCSTDKDCIDLAKSWGVADEDIQYLIEQGFVCSLEYI